MNRLKISVGILVLLAVLCASGLFTVNRQCRHFTAQTADIMDAVASGDTEEALAMCDTLLRMWEDFHDITGLFVDGEQLDHIRGTLAGLRSLIEQEHPEAMSRLEALRTLTEELFREELPDLWHIM